MPKKYLLIDTNIFVQCCLLEIEGDDLKVLRELKKLLEANKLFLLLPEVIELEFRRKIEETFSAVSNFIEQHKKKINDDGSVKEKIKKDLCLKLDEYRAEKEKVKEKAKNEIEKLFANKNVIKNGLELTPEILVAAYRQYIVGEKPFSKRDTNGALPTLQTDCMIIECVRSFLKTKKDYELYLCTYNKNDFSENSKNLKGLEIAKDIAKHFKHIQYYSNLYVLLEEKFGKKYPKEDVDKLNDSMISLQPVKSFDPTEYFPRMRPLTLAFSEGTNAGLMAEPLTLASFGTQSDASASNLQFGTVVHCRDCKQLKSSVDIFGLCDGCRGTGVKL